MISQNYLRSSTLGGGFPFLHGLRQASRTSVQRPPSDFSFLLELDDLQTPKPPVPEHEITNQSRYGTLDDSGEQVLARLQLGLNGETFWSLADFERDMDLLAEGLEDLHIQYQGTYSREDIYLDDQ